MMSAAEKIKEIRLALCMGKKEFSELLEINPVTVWYWEKGDRTPTFAHIRKLIEHAKTVGINVKATDFLEN